MFRCLLLCWVFVVLVLFSLLILFIKLFVVWLVVWGKVVLGVGVIFVVKVGGMVLLVWLF